MRLLGRPSGIEFGILGSHAQSTLGLSYKLTACVCKYFVNEPGLP
jgi:hypothetical protein